MPNNLQKINISSIKEILREYIQNSNNPDMLEYGRAIIADLDKYIIYMRKRIDIAEMHNASVLDVGCGFGWECLLISLIGNNKVVANDIRENNISMVNERLKSIQEKFGIEFDIKTLLGDICQLRLGDEVFDVIFSNQTIEHCHNLEDMFIVCSKALKKGGRLMLLNTNNCYSRETVRKNIFMWKLRDSSWEYIEKLKKEKPIENREIEPYKIMREKIIKNTNPYLSNEDVDKIANATAGLVKKEIENITMQYPEKSLPPLLPALSWCRNPITEEYCERLLNPYELQNILKEAGFNVQIKHTFRVFPLNLLNNIILKPLNILLFNIKSEFLILARKL